MIPPAMYAGPAAQIKQKMLVLTYHAVFADEKDWAAQPASDRWYSLKQDQFRVQMEHLVRNGYRTLLLREFLEGESPEKSLVLTFDDGHDSNFHVVLPILKQFGLRAEFFITVANVGLPGFMAWEELKLLQEAGMSVQSHGLHHQPLTGLDLDMLRDELRVSKKLLEQYLGSPVNYFAIPGGFADERVYVEILNAGYRAICNSEPGLASKGEVIARIPVMHSTSLATFSDLADRKLASLKRMSAQRRLAKAAKSLLGLRRYEALKHIKLRLSK